MVISGDFVYLYQVRGGWQYIRRFETHRPAAVKAPLTFGNAVKIQSLQPRLFRVPLPEPMEDARHPTHTHFELVTATVHTTEGVEGTGYTYTGGHAIFQLLESDSVY